jgi:hypothetical protein
LATSFSKSWFRRPTRPRRGVSSTGAARAAIWRSFRPTTWQALRTRVDGLGIRRVWNVDLPDISASHLHPADIGGAIVSVDEPRPAGSWRWGGPGWRDRSAPGRFTHAVLETPDPDALAQKWGLVFGLTADRRRLFLADAVLHFTEGPADRMIEFGFDMPDADQAIARAKEKDLPVEGRSISIAGITLNLNG